MFDYSKRRPKYKSISSLESQDLFIFLKEIRIIFVLCLFLSTDVAAKQDSGDPGARRLGHEGQAVPHRSGDQSLGHRMLRTTTPMQRRGSKVRQMNKQTNKQTEIVKMIQDVWD